MKKQFYNILLGVALVVTPNLYGQKNKTSFAIVIDSLQATKLQKELKDYKEVLEDDGLKVFVLAKNWKSPELIKQNLKELYEKQKLEGAVFIGDIPVPMIRDAQHLTSTFKMPQNLDWMESSVPSDRYYDDFDLEFKFLKQDQNNKHLFYYSLDENSPQFIQMDIYSGRLKPPTDNFDESIIYIKSYLEKAIRERKSKNEFNTISTYTAEGYNSNALNSWNSLVFGFRNQFSAQFKNPNSVKFASYNNQDFMKDYWLSQLKRNDLDYAYFNGHGLPDMQIVSANPEGTAHTSSMQNVSKYVREQMRRAKDKNENLAEKQLKLQETLGLNDKWFTDFWDENVTIADSIYDNKKIISFNDLQNWDINAKLVYLDACLNGAFQYTDYIAAYYPFSNGNNQVVFANSVGVLQDLWANEMMGLIQTGARVGEVLKNSAYLETHIFGDPSYHFYTKDNKQWNADIAHNSDVDFWINELTNSVSDVQALALNKLVRLQTKDKVLPLVVNQFYNNINEGVRTEAFLLLKELQPSNWNEILIDALKDNHEYIRRIAVYEMGENGSDEFIQPLVQLYFNDQSSNRTTFNVERMLDFFDNQKVLESIAAEKQKHLFYDDAVVENLSNKFKKGSFLVEYYLKMENDSLKESDQKFAFSILRAYRFHQYVPVVCTYILTKDLTEEKQIAALEALSWFNKSTQKEVIISTCKNIIANNTYSKSVKDQAQHTIKILES